MNLNDVKLPSNKKFGYFFSCVFLICSCFFIYSNNLILGSIFAGLVIIFIIITLFCADILLPLNKTWMSIGLVIGKIISPIILGIIFFGLVTPYGVVMRILGRDELRLKLNQNSSNWIERSENSSKNDFRKQF